jgi:hypothetical protein
MIPPGARGAAPKEGDKASEPLCQDGVTMDEEGNRAAREAAQFARVALIVAVMALALSILGLFLPIR